MQQRHASANKALFSNLHICRQTHAASSVYLSPVDWVRYTEQPSSHAHNRIFADTDGALG